MDDSTLTVFISSKMQELAAERTALYDLLTQMSSGPLKIKPWAYEKDAYAANYPIRDVYLKILEESALYIGLFWKEYGDWTIDEFRRATEWHIDRLLFVKADERDNRKPQLNEFLDEVAPVDKGLAPVWFTDVDDLSKKVEHSLKVWINEKLTYRPGSANAILVTDPDDVPHQPRKLIGREDLLAQLRAALLQNSRVLLQGFGGMGKTALAATAAAEYLKANPGPMLWQEIGKESSDAIFEALARPFNAVQQIAKEHGDAKIQAMRALLRQRGVKLLVLDNAWDGPALKTVLEAVPRDVPVIVTSRHAYPLDMRIEVDELSPASAVETLAFYAGNPALINDPAAADLCQLLGYLAFALEIAGKQLMVDKLTPAQLKTRIESAPAKMNMPLSFSQEGRRSVGDLLETSIEALDKDTRRVFMTFGAFFAPQITAKVLMGFLAKKPELSPAVLAKMRADLPRVAHLSDERLIELVHIASLQANNLAPLETALQFLAELGLVKNVDATTEQVAAYRVHDLAHSYLQVQFDENGRDRALDACLDYIKFHDVPSPESFAALLPELDNLMGAATWAYSTGRYAALEDFIQYLWHRSEFLNYQGFYGHATRLLENAANAAKHRGDFGNQGAHLDSLGVAYFSLGEYSKAIDYHSQALLIQRQINNQKGEGNALGNLGNIYRILNNNLKAIDCYEQALAIAQQTGDNTGEGNALGNLGNVYISLSDYHRAKDFHQRALALSRRIGNRRAEGQDLNNLGSTYADLGETHKAIDCFQQALVLARQIGDKQSEALALGNLGASFADLADHRKAIDYYQQTLVIVRQIDDKYSEAIALSKLGDAYAERGANDKATECYQKAYMIFLAIGVQNMAELLAAVIADMPTKSRKWGLFRR